MKLNRLLFALLMLPVLMLGACRDDLLYDPEVGEGEADMRFTIGFEPMYTGLDNTRAPGNAVNSINSVTVVAYKQDGTLYKIWRSADGDFTYTTTENTDMPSDFTPSADPDTGDHQAEAKTPKVNFTLEDIPFGRYRIYALANIDVTDDEARNADSLKAITVDWQSEVSANNAMFGYFTTDNSGVSATEFTAPLITLNSPAINLTAWLKRTVSKVTVAFDARRLNENITIYLKDVQIKDIPTTCQVGVLNEPNSTSLIEANGETITYQEGTSYNDSWKASVTRGDPIYGAMGKYTGTKPADMSTADWYKQLIRYQHQETTPALYFFENVQGTGVSGTASDKRQDVNGQNHSVSYPDGNNPSSEAFKDAKRYGTYIEVHAYYVNTSSTNNTQGDIIYRFMLGQDDHLDYNAYRNRHYKLTMSFNGNANDVDWHIVYDDSPVRFPRPYYISYLYNHSMMCPITIEAGDKEVEWVEAKIVSNNWAPMNPGNLIYWSAGNKPETEPWNGFLSLWQTTQTTIVASPPFTSTSNKPYYEGTSRGVRRYNDMTEGDHVSPYDGSLPNPDEAPSTDRYYVKITQDPEKGRIYDLSIPMYTRAKQLIKQTAFTGNNPYVAYRRDAKVQLTIKYKGIEQPFSPDSLLDIIQVRRVVNPKGIYRKWNSTRSFHVNLKCLENEEASSFVPLTSLGGPWKAYVVRASGTNYDENGKELGTSDMNYTEDAHNMLTFSGGSRVYKAKKGITNESDTVYGETGSQIDFNILFKNSCSSQNKSRHAVIRVEYNNNTCYHLIFVRQGKAPVPLYEGGARWHSGNMISQSQEADSPIDEGSLFKFGNWDWPIASTSNVNSILPWINIVPNSFIDNNGSKLTIVGKTGTHDWREEGFTGSTSNSFSNPTSGGRVAQLKDFAKLYELEEIEEGYGVLYGDDATETGVTLKEVYGYRSGEPKTYGIRGTFVYSKSTGVNVFFPIGNSGYGHRKDTGTFVAGSSWSYANGSQIYGLLRYSCNGRWGYFPDTALGTAYPDGVNGCPLFYDIFMRPGAVYYLDKNYTNVHTQFPIFNTDNDVATACAWDFNYFTFDFYPLSATNLGGGKDACFVRCVDD